MLKFMWQKCVECFIQWIYSIIQRMQLPRVRSALILCELLFMEKFYLIEKMWVCDDFIFLQVKNNINMYAIPDHVIFFYYLKWCFINHAYVFEI